MPPMAAPDSGPMVPGALTPTVRTAMITPGSSVLACCAAWLVGVSGGEVGAHPGMQARIIAGTRKRNIKLLCFFDDRRVVADGAGKVIGLCGADSSPGVNPGLAWAA